jgi:hypothetical protein
LTAFRRQIGKGEQLLWTCRGTIEQRRDSGYAYGMPSDRALSGFKLIEVTEPGILASLERIDAMSDDAIRKLACDEPQIIVDAGEGIIADRHKGRAGAPQGP